VQHHVAGFTVRHSVESPIRIYPPRHGLKQTRHDRIAAFGTFDELAHSRLALHRALAPDAAVPPRTARLVEQ